MGAGPVVTPIKPTKGAVQAPSKGAPQRGPAVYIEMGPKVVPLHDRRSQQFAANDDSPMQTGQSGIHTAEDIFATGPLGISSALSETSQMIGTVKFLDKALSVLGAHFSYRSDARIPDEDQSTSEVADRHAQSIRDGAEIHLFGPWGIGLTLGVSVARVISRWPMGRLIETLARPEVDTIGTVRNAFSGWIGVYLPQSDRPE